MRLPVSAKGVVLDEKDRVLLGMNDRREWELLGGRLEHGEAPEDAVRREIREEAGLLVAPAQLLRAWILQPVPGSDVLILSYGCRIESGVVNASDEHSQVRFHDRDELRGLVLPVGYRTDIDIWWRQRDLLQH